MPLIKFVDMFSGIGGFREGLTLAGGFECVGHCEIDKYANRSYNALFDTKGEWFMNWDCGRSLALIPGVDSFSRLPSPKEKAGDAR